MNNEIMMYGIAQKEQQGFDSELQKIKHGTPALHMLKSTTHASLLCLQRAEAVEECKYRMSRYGVRPNMLILPPQMLLYMALAPEARLTYEKGGPNADARFEAGYEGFESRSFRGCTVVTSEPFEVSDDADSVQMLTRSSQIGEFYVMQPPQVDPGNDRKRHSCDVLIYDEEKDAHVRITWGDAMKACLIVGDGGIAVAADGIDGAAPFNIVGGLTGTQWLAAAKAIDDWQNGADSNLPAVGAKAAGRVPDWDDVKDLVSKIRIVLARPFIEHMMHSVVMTVSGRDTGATLFGPADMQLSANTQVKTIEGYVCIFEHKPRGKHRPM